MIVFGRVLSMVQSKLAGVGSVTPPAVAWTWKVCRPIFNLVRVSGLMHPANGPPSLLQVKVAVGSFEVKLKIAVVPFVAPPEAAVGPELMKVSSASLSVIVTVSLLGVPIT